MNGFRISRLAIVLGAAMAVSAAQAQDDCGLCNKEVVINADLADCFLDKFPEYASAASGTVTVDLTQCSTRGVFEALGMPSANAPKPNTRFLLSRTQLSCLKQKLEDPDIVLDPSATIELSDCR